MRIETVRVQWTLFMFCSSFRTCPLIFWHNIVNPVQFTLNLSDERWIRHWDAAVAPDMISPHKQMSTTVLLLSISSLMAQSLMCDSETEFECKQNGRCLNHSLICSGVPQCGFLPFLDVSDIEPGLCSNCSLPGIFPCSWLGQLVTVLSHFAGLSKQMFSGVLEQRSVSVWWKRKLRRR